MQVRLYATLRQTAGTKAVEIPVKVNQTVGDILRALVDQYPELSEAIWNADGSLAGHVAVILNGRDIRHLDNVDTLLSGDDTLALFPPVGGGVSEEEDAFVTLNDCSCFHQILGKESLPISKDTTMKTTAGHLARRSSLHY